MEQGWPEWSGILFSPWLVSSSCAFILRNRIPLSDVYIYIFWTVGRWRCSWQAAAILAEMFWCFHFSPLVFLFYFLFLSHVQDWLSQQYVVPIAKGSRGWTKGLCMCRWWRSNELDGFAGFFPLHTKWLQQRGYDLSSLPCWSWIVNWSTTQIWN